MAFFQGTFSQNKFPKTCRTHLLDFIYYILDFHTFLVKSHGHRGGQGPLVKGKGTWAPGPSPGAPWAGPRPGPRRGPGTLTPLD